MADWAKRGEVTLKRARRGIRAVVGETGAGDRKAILALPTTSMNHAGQAVAPLLSYFDAEPESLLVVHDDIDLPFGKLKVQFSRGSGGHNGVASIAGSLDSQEFWRLKMGVGRPPGSMDPADFVLRRFGARERDGVDLMVEVALDVLDAYVAEGPAEARQRAGEAAAPR